VWNEAGTYRVIYTARVADAVYVLHAFQKKSQATSQRDLDIVVPPRGANGAGAGPRAVARAQERVACSGVFDPIRAAR
jgi:hypothetical protein